MQANRQIRESFAGRSYLQAGYRHNLGQPPRNCLQKLIRLQLGIIIHVFDVEVDAELGLIPGLMADDSVLSRRRITKFDIRLYL